MRDWIHEVFLPLSQLISKSNLLAVFAKAQLTLFNWWLELSRGVKNMFADFLYTLSFCKD